MYVYGLTDQYTVYCYFSFWRFVPRSSQPTPTVAMFVVENFDASLPHCGYITVDIWKHVMPEFA